MMEKGRATDDKRLGKYSLITDEEDPRFLLGFALPLMWYYAAILFVCNYYQKDPRERSGLAASATAAFIFSVALFVALCVIFL